MGALKQVHLEEPKALRGGGSRIDGVLEGADGQVQVSGVCLPREGGPAALIVLQSGRGSASLVERMEVTMTWVGRGAAGPVTANSRVAR